MCFLSVCLCMWVSVFSSFLTKSNAKRCYSHFPFFSFFVVVAKHHILVYLRPVMSWFSLNLIFYNKFQKFHCVLGNSFSWMFSLLVLLLLLHFSLLIILVFCLLLKKEFRGEFKMWKSQFENCYCCCCCFFFLVCLFWFLVFRRHVQFAIFHFHFRIYRTILHRYQYLHL